MSTPPAAAPLSEPQLTRAMRLNIAAGAVGMMWAAVAYGMPLPLFMEAIGASGKQLGAIGALRQLAMLGQIPAAFLVERMARRKPFWVVVVMLHRAMWAIPAVLPLLLPGRRDLYPVIVITALALSDFLANLGSGPWMSWMADLLPPERSGRFWGVRQRILSATLIIAATAFGKLLDHFPASAGLTGFCVVFALCALGGMGDIVIHCWVHEPPLVPHPGTEPMWERIVAPLRHPAFRRLTLALGAWSCAISMPGIANGLPGFFNVLYLKESFGATYSQASLLLIASAIGGVSFLSWVGQLIDHKGARWTIVRLIVIGSTATLAWFFVTPGRLEFWLPLFGQQSIPQAVVLMSAASVVIGGCYAGVLLCQYRLSAMYTPAEGRTVPMAVHWSAVGLMASIGPMIAGYIKDHFPVAWSTHHLPGGAPFSYFQIIILLQVLILWFVAVPLLRRER